MAGPVLFLALQLVQELAQPDYSPMSMPISALAVWPLGWLQNLNFFLYALLMFVVAAGLNRAIAADRGGRLAVVLLSLVGVGAILLCAFPYIRVDGRPVEPPAHGVGAILHFAAASFFAMAVSRRMQADPLWAGLWRYALATGAAMLSLFVILAFYAIDPGMPLNSIAGVIQRITVTIWELFLFVMGWRMWKVSQRAPRPRIRA